MTTAGTVYFFPGAGMMTDVGAYEGMTLRMDDPRTITEFAVNEIFCGQRRYVHCYHGVPFKLGYFLNEPFGIEINPGNPHECPIRCLCRIRDNQSNPLENACGGHL